MTCGHDKHGDFVNGYWVCGDCYKKLHDRPKKYKMVRIGYGDPWDNNAQHRQEVIPCPIATSEDGMTLSEFIKAMAMRLIHQTKGGFQMVDALDYSIEILRCFDDPFGSKDMDWDVSGAFELISEDMQYWDCDGADGSNT